MKTSTLIKSKASLQEMVEVINGFQKDFAEEKKVKVYVKNNPFIAAYFQAPDYLLSPDLVELYTAIDELSLRELVMERAEHLATTVTISTFKHHRGYISTKIFSQTGFEHLLELRVMGNVTHNDTSTFSIDSTNCIDLPNGWLEYLNKRLTWYQIQEKIEASK